MAENTKDLGQNWTQILFWFYFFNKQVIYFLLSQLIYICCALQVDLSLDHIRGHDNSGHMAILAPMAPIVIALYMVK